MREIGSSAIEIFNAAQEKRHKSSRSCMVPKLSGHLTFQVDVLMFMAFQSRYPSILFMTVWISETILLRRRWNSKETIP